MDKEVERKKKILLIEDNKKLLNNLKLFLESNGYLIDTTTDGESGIIKTRDSKPDLVICDISIPIKDGYEVLKELSIDKNTMKIPFIFLTAKVEKDDFRKGMQLGADDYIFKPFDFNDLLTSIENRFSKLSLLKGNKNPKSDSKEKSYKIDDKILINFGKKMEYFNVRDIKYIKTEHPYIYVKFSNNKNSLLRDSLNDWEEKLPENYFIRVSQSSIINIDYVIKIEKISNSSYLIRIKEEAEPFIVSRRYKNNVKSYLP